MSRPLPETVLQFGTGKFLRCFTDLFLHEANQGDRPPGKAVGVQSTGSQRAEWLNERGGRYRMAIRGLQQGQPVDRVVEVASVARALTADDQWAEVLDLARSESLRTIVSNTTEAGYALDDADQPDGTPPRSFPAKLLAVVRARHEAGLGGLTVLSCELFDNNADRLRELVHQQARRWRVSDALLDWLTDECRWHNTLVDRIVSAPADGDPMAATDPLFAVAEPFALWLIEGSAEVPGLVDHPAVQLVDDVQPYSLRKVRILNGAHTALVAKALPAGFETVRAAVEDPEIGAWLRALLFEEIVPTIEDRTEDAERFAQTTLERFANPFLEHRLADIALHHETKLQTRLVPTRDEFRARFGRSPERLDAILSS